MGRKHNTYRFLLNKRKRKNTESLLIARQAKREHVANDSKPEKTDGVLTVTSGEKSQNSNLIDEVVLESWWNTGGTVQFTYDVMRNLVPAFAPPTKLATDLTLLPKLLEACKLLNLDYDDARRLRASLAKGPGGDSIHLKSIRYIYPEEALQILSQRTDLADDSPPSVLEMF